MDVMGIPAQDEPDAVEGEQALGDVVTVLEILKTRSIK
jgi:hypothetical protein